MDIENAEERVATVKEIAFYLRVDRTVVERLLRSGKLKGIKVGAHWRIRIKDLKEYMGV